MKHIIIIHGYKSYPGDCWFPWLKKELEKHGFKVNVSRFTNPSKPNMKKWINVIRKSVGEPSKDTFFVGHSLGTMAIIRYLETLKPTQKIGGAVFVAGRVIIRPSKSMVSSFFKTPINWSKLNKLSKKYVGIYSIDDPLVSTENGRLLKQKLNATLILEKNKGHFSRSDGIIRLKSVLTAILEIDNQHVSR